MAMAMAKSLCDLPEVLLAEIFFPLPVKSLLLCKSVCKTWLSIISHSNFIKSHLHRVVIASRHNPTLFTIQDSRPNRGEQDCYPSATDMFFGHGFITKTRLELASTYPLHFDRLVLPRIFKFTHVNGSCDGLICLSNNYHNRFFLWNPTIRQYKKLRPPPQRCSDVIGFGYDSISDDYKVLGIVYDESSEHGPILQVYSTNADCWREFRIPILRNLNLHEKTTNIVVNGLLYFSDWNKLFSFDLQKEVVEMVPFPSFIQSRRSDVLEFEGSVAMVFESEPGIDLWMLDNVSGMVSWSKKFSIIESDWEMEIWLSVYLAGGLFYGRHEMHDDYMNDLMYDYKKKETTVYGIQEYGVLATITHTETLVSVKGFEQIDENDN